MMLKAKIVGYDQNHDGVPVFTFTLEDGDDMEMEKLTSTIDANHAKFLVDFTPIAEGSDPYALMVQDIAEMTHSPESLIGQDYEGNI